MDHPEQLVSKVAICFFLVLFSCAEPKTPLSINASSPNLDLTKALVVFENIPFSGLAYEFYPGTKDTLWTKSYKAGLKNGIWRKYYSAGALREKRLFINGKKEGEYVGYYSNGTKNFIFQFNNGEYDGTNKIWTEKGLLIEEGNFKEGYEFGVQKTWYLNGKIKSNYIIKNNRRYGLLGTKNCVNVSSEIPKT